MSKRSVVVVAPVRTAIGTFGGSLKDVRNVTAPFRGRDAEEASKRIAALGGELREEFRG